MTESSAEWRKCSACRQPIQFGATYYTCSVSTCQRARTNVVFCSVSCWQAHNVSVRHRDAWAEEDHAPSKAQWLAAQQEVASETSAAPRPARRVVETAAPSPAPAPQRATQGPVDRELESDVLVVVSKLKKYIRAQSGMNTSDNVVGALSDHLRKLSVAAIRVAATDGRRTVMDRDFIKVLRED